MTLRAKTLALAALFVAGAVVSAQAVPDRPWLIRGRLSNYQANDSSGLFKSTALTGTGVGVTSDWGGSFGLSFFPHRNLALELSMGFSQPDFTATQAGKGLGTLADCTMMPVTLTTQWHPFPLKTVRPYLGFGVNYTGFFHENASPTLEMALGGPTDVRMNDSWGVVGQSGLDIVFCKNWVVNVDVKYSETDTTLKTHGGGVDDEANVNVNPWTLSTGVGYRF